MALICYGRSELWRVQPEVLQGFGEGREELCNLF
jgi:hypothetical protein